MSAAWVLNNLRDVAERCMQSVPVLDRKGEQVYVKTPAGELAAAYTFEASSANRALELIGKHFGAFPEKVQHSGTMTVETLLAQVGRLKR